MEDFKKLIGRKVLVTTNNWFVAPDGVEYRAVYGTLKNVCEAKEVLGFAPSRQHANWFVMVGGMTITGCQVNYLIDAGDKTMQLGRTKSWSNMNNEFKEYERPTIIYAAD